MLEKFKKFVSAVLYYERLGVELARAMLIDGAVWVFAYLGGFAIYQQPWFWAGLAPLILVGLGIVGSYTREVPKPSYNPELTGAVHQVHFGHFTKTENQVFLVATISNTGDPSAVANWILGVQVLGEDQWKYGTLEPVPQTVQVQSWIYDGRDALYGKVAGKPLGQGQTVSGMLIFTIADVDEQNLTRPETLYALTFTDVAQRPYIFNFRYPSGGNVPQYWPGMTQLRPAIQPGADADKDETKP